MEVAVREAGLSPHVKCFVHTLNLASRTANVSRLLGTYDRLSFFHCSTTATAVLAARQSILMVAEHELIVDVVTRWNSSMGKA